MYPVQKCVSQALFSCCLKIILRINKYGGLRMQAACIIFEEMPEKSEKKRVMRAAVAKFQSGFGSPQPQYKID